MADETYLVQALLSPPNLYKRSSVIASRTPLFRDAFSFCNSFRSGHSGELHPYKLRQSHFPDKLSIIQPCLFLVALGTRMYFLSKVEMASYELYEAGLREIRRCRK